MNPRHKVISVLLWAALDVPMAAAQSGGQPYQCTPPEGACADYDCLKHVYWGDLHVHTSYSLDSYIWANRNDPAAAYAFARGDSLAIASASPSGETPDAQLSRPLDFAAVTDHSEFLSVSGRCLIDDGDGSLPCERYTRQNSLVQALIGLQAMSQLSQVEPQQPTMCSPSGDPEACELGAQTAWQRVQLAAESANQACEFTSFVGYEWSATTDGDNLHRNVIFGTSSVPERACDYLSYPNPLSLWQALDEGCKAEDDCDVVTLPHNSNYSNARMWETVSDPASRAYMERYQIATEIFQHKGSSECLAQADFGDPRCAFEQSTGAIGAPEGGPTDPALSDESAAQYGPGYVRNALAQGLSELARTGNNPLELGVLGSTDTHNGTPGNVEEGSYYGHLSMMEDTARERLRDYPYANPGGLTGIWAEQNTREALYGALKRREVFATSGPRISVRLYALEGVSDEEAQALCADADVLAKLAARGAVPMGGRATYKSRPRIFVMALRDTEELDEIDVVRLAADSSGEVSMHIESRPLAGDQRSSACVHWEDPDWAADSPSLYYARAFQVPTARWSERDCALHPLMTGCGPRGALRQPIVERAWTSPIFFRP